MNTKKMLISLGAAVATSKLAKTITSLDADDFLGTVGLARRRNHALENVALISLGAVIGAGAALLFAPASGSETRSRIGKKVESLGESASQAIREVRDELPSIQSLKHAARNGAYTDEHAEHRS